MRAYIEAIGKLSGAESGRDGDCEWSRSGIGWPMFNGGIGRDIEAVKRTLAVLDPIDGTPFFWWCTDENGGTLSDLLDNHGLTVFEAPAPWMESAVADLPDAELPAGGKLIEVTDSETARVWCDTLVAAFEFPAVGGDPWFEAIERAGYDAAPWRLWLAHHEGTPAGVTLGFNGGGVAGLFGMAVVPTMRRLGYGRFLTLHPLQEAAKTGELLAGFFATQSGLPLYESLGFRRRGSVTRWLGGASPFAERPQER